MPTMGMLDNDPTKALREESPMKKIERSSVIGIFFLIFLTALPVKIQALVDTGQGLAEGSAVLREQQSRSVSGRLIIKYREETEFAVENLNPARSAISSAPLPEALQALNQRFGLIRMRPLFADLHNKGMRALDQMTINNALYPQRTDRAPRSPKIPALENVMVLEFPAETDLQAATRAYEGLPTIDYVQPDYRYHAAWTEPNDPFWSSTNSWGQGHRDLYGLHKIQCPLAWDKGRGGDVVVAVIDTGVDRDHEDLAGRIWTNSAEIPDNHQDDDGNGYIDDTWGWSFVGKRNNPRDQHGHGTHCAGTIAAATNNGIGTAGILWEGKIMAIQGLSANGSGSTTGLAQAINYAADMGADVISMSWGAFFPYRKNLIDRTLSEALDYAYAAGCVLVAAAGNDRADARYCYPANHPRVITVAALDPQGRLAGFSTSDRR
jgi:subtilisin family serine protease